MLRRTFLAIPVILVLFACDNQPPGGSSASGGPSVEGARTEHAVLAEGWAAPKGEVVEFFSYNCPHCSSAAGEVESWAERHEGAISVRYVPVVFRKEWLLAAEVFAVTESLGVKTAHRELFSVFQSPMGFSEPALFKALAAHGIDRNRFEGALHSPDVAERMRRYQELTQKARVSGVPSFAVSGKYEVSLRQAGGLPEALAEIEQLTSRSN